MMVTIWPSLYRPAEGRRVALRALLARVAEPRTYASKDDVPRWSFGTFRHDHRRLDAFENSVGIALDIDQSATAEQIGQAFGECCGFGHTSWTRGRWRVGILLDRPVDREEHDRVWRAGAELAERAGLQPDYAARDASRAWALPAARPHYEHVEFTGALLDVDAALARFPKPKPMPEPQPFDRTETYDRRVERAARYLARMPGAIQGAHGSDATFRAAVAMVRGFRLEPKEALRLLTEIHNPLCQPPWSLRELQHKVRQASQRARVPEGYIADRRRDGRAA
jgi:hypothetical protein